MKAMHLTREELYEQVWSEPLTKIARHLGISDVGLAKACARAKIPTPPRGYWAKQAAGKPSKKPTLPVRDKWQPALITIVPTPPRPSTSEKLEAPNVPYEDIAAAIEREKNQTKPIRADESLRDPHRLVRRDIAQEKEWKARSTYGGIYQPDQDPGEPLKKRRWSLLSGLLKALEERGHEIGVPHGGNGAMHYPLTLFKETFSLQFKELIRQARRQLTKEEQASSWNGKQLWTQERFPTGELTFSLGRYKPSPWDQWKDHPNCPLEDQLRDVLIGLYYAAAEARTRRIEREQAERREREVQHRRWLDEQARQREAKRVAALMQQAIDWRSAAKVRAYAAAVTQAAEAGHLRVDRCKLEAWSVWAARVADTLDPITANKIIEWDIDGDLNES